LKEEAEFKAQHLLIKTFCDEIDEIHVESEQVRDEVAVCEAVRRKAATSARDDCVPFALAGLVLA
jgi:hypothetical protein